jgi:hypothetical protein
MSECLAQDTTFLDSILLAMKDRPSSNTTLKPLHHPVSGVPGLVADIYTRTQQALCHAVLAASGVR